MKKKTLITIGSIVLVAVVGFMVVSGCSREELRFNTAKAQVETLQFSVTATGYIQPVDKVDVGTQVSGVIEKIYVDYNSRVKKGQLIAELDKSTLIERKNQANANLTSALSALGYAQQNYDRTKQLYDVKAATKVAYEEAVNQLTQAQSTVSDARANLKQAQVNLAYAEIYSPIDGIVLNRAVEQGQTVAASFSTPTLFTIANDLTKMQVEANIDEADIGEVRLGQAVVFTVDAYPDDEFKGTVSQIRLQPTVTSNVVTYTVIIEAPNPDEKLFPGMTANITVITQSKEGLAIPLSALSYSPGQDVVKAFKLDMSKVGSGARKAKGVWVKTANGIEHRPLTTGLADGVNVLVTSGLQANEEVILSVYKGKKVANGAAANPLMPRRPGR